VSLVLIGLAALGGCGEEKKRDVYASREDCLADWGNKPEECTPSNDPKHRGMGYFYGPLYLPRSSGFLGLGGGSDSPGSSFSRSRSSGSSSVSRGGFGSSSRSSGG
jgi:uncharacterized protein YgiB involved in biofilm formation